jgi:hypothetical protein
VSAYFISPTRMEQLDRYSLDGDALIDTFNCLLSARGSLMGNQRDWFDHGDWEDAIIDLVRKMKPTVYTRLDKLEGK